jgi:hypothetical protein
MVIINIFPEKNYLQRNKTSISIFVCTTVLYEYMNSPKNEINNSFNNTHVQIKIYREFYHDIIYIANEGRRVIIIVLHVKLLTIIKQSTLNRCYYFKQKINDFNGIKVSLHMILYRSKKKFLLRSLAMH